MKNSKHNKLLKNYEQEKRRHLYYLASKMLKKQDLFDRLKSKNTDGGFLDKI